MGPKCAIQICLPSNLTNHIQAIGLFLLELLLVANTFLFLTLNSWRTWLKGCLWEQVGIPNHLLFLPLAPALLPTKFLMLLLTEWTVKQCSKNQTQMDQTTSCFLMDLLTSPEFFFNKMLLDKYKLHPLIKRKFFILITIIKKIRKYIKFIIVFYVVFLSNICP